MTNRFKRKQKRIDSLSEAQTLAFAPLTFQALATMLDLGVLNLLDKKEATLEEIITELKLSEYTAKTLLQIGETTNLVEKKDNKFSLSKKGEAFLYDEMTIADITGCKPNTGVLAEGLVKVFDEMGWDYQVNKDGDYYYETLEDFEADVIKNIDAGVPMMIAWMDWSGHWEVIIGIDTMQEDNPSDDVLIVADPYDTSDHYQDGYYVIPAERFYYMWNEVFSGDGRAQSFIVAQPAE